MFLIGCGAESEVTKESRTWFVVLGGCRTCSGSSKEVRHGLRSLWVLGHDPRSLLEGPGSLC